MLDRRPLNPIEILTAVIAVAFGVALCLFSIRNNDVWWSMAVGRRIMETHHFIHTDPFTFTVIGTPWSPQHWLAGVVFYWVHSLGGAAGLIALRVLMVGAATVLTFLSVRRASVSWLLAAPIIVLGLLVMRTRFTVRAHLFEYVFLTALVYFLLTCHERRGKSFFVIPVAMQVIWTNAHPSFFLGPALVALFFIGEKAGEHMGSFGRPLHRRDWKRFGLLVALMSLACLVNPDPVAFLTQPFSGEQKELITRFTLEWKSPFDPALATAGFRPYYEILMAIAALTLLVSFRRTVPSAALLLVATAAMSLQAHRFRSEFVLVGIPMMCVLVGASSLYKSLTERAGRSSVGRAVIMGFPILALLILIIANYDRIEIGPAVEDRYPDRALEFVAANDIAHRPYHPIGFGSYMTWKLYGQRQTFIDGRNFSSELYTDFLGVQRSKKGFVSVVDKYDVDSFILPAPEVSDFGMKNVHEGTLDSSRWATVYMDERAFVCVDTASVPADWLESHRYRYYHPMTLPGLRVNAELIDRIITEIERAIKEAPNYPRLAQDHKAALAVRERIRAASARGE